MFTIILIICSIFYLLGWLAGEEEYKSPLPFIVACLISAIIFYAHVALNDDNHPIYGYNLADYKHKENVLLPSNSVGRIDGIYYFIEGDLYDESILRKSDEKDIKIKKDSTKIIPYPY